jgi:hypothetical protein
VISRDRTGLGCLGLGAAWAESIGSETLLSRPSLASGGVCRVGLGTGTLDPIGGWSAIDSGLEVDNLASL